MLPNIRRDAAGGGRAPPGHTEPTQELSNGGRPLHGLWRAFASSYDAERAAAGSTPLATLFAVGSLSAAVLLVAYLPAFRGAEFHLPWVSVALAAIGGLFTFVAWRHGCSGRWGTPATLLDNSLYVASMTWAACNTQSPYSFFLAGCLALTLLGFQGPSYGLSVLMTGAITGPVVVIALVASPPALVSLALACGCLLCLVRMEVTRSLARSAGAARPARSFVRGVSGARYRLVAPIGSGGTATVHRAVGETGDVVAIKILHARWVGSLPQSKNLFKEVLIANSLPHDGIVEILDYGVSEDGAPFLVMEYLVGQTLAQHIDACGGRLDWRHAVRICLALLEILEAAHTRGVIHCDVKPNNVFLLGDGAIKLLDFGIARDREQLLDLTFSVHIAGTPTCMAPEQLLAPHSVDGRADLYGVAASLYRAVAGDWPRAFLEPRASLVEAMQLRARPLEAALHSIPRELADVVNRGLEHDPAARWASAAAFRNALLACLDESSAHEAAASASSA